MKIYRLPDRIFVELDNGGFGEVAPLLGRSRESLEEAHLQLQRPEGELFPSVAFALMPLPQKEIRWPTAALLMGTVADILKQAKRFSDFTHAKIKVGKLSVKEAVSVVKELKDHFRLRIDINSRWSVAEINEFCSHFTPADFDYIEDPPQEVNSFPHAADERSFFAPDKIVWKPTVQGIPPKLPNLVLSSAWESGIGIANIVRLADYLDLPRYPIGVGTYHFLENDFLEEPLRFSKGVVTIPAKLRPRC